MLRGLGESGEPRMIGVVGTKGETENEGEAEMAYMLYCDFWKKGYMTEALIAFAGPEGVYWSLGSMFVLAISL